jgi:hypothetical protein
VTGGLSAGGLIGFTYMHTKISECFAMGDVTTNGEAGGLAGVGQGISNSYAMGAVMGDYGIHGGLIASADLLNSTSYPIGSVAGSGAYVGGSVGTAGRATFTNLFWDIRTSERRRGCGGGDCSGVAGLRDRQLRSGLPAGFDPAIWGQKKGINNGYPYLRANPPPQ